MRDINDRPYALVTEVTEGSTVEADGDFTCLDEDMRYWVYLDKSGLYIECEEGKHYLDGQIIWDEIPFYIGLYLVG